MSSKREVMCFSAVTSQETQYSAQQYLTDAETAMQTKKWEQAALLWDNFRIFFPDREEGYLRGYKAHLALKQYGKASDLLQTAVRLFPRSPAPLIGLANTAFQAACFFETAELGRYLIRKYPKSFEGYIYLGQALHKLKEVDAAEAVLQEAYTIFDDKPALLEALAESAMVLHNWKVAAERWKSLRRVAIKNPKGFSRGYIPLMKLGNYLAAEKLLKKAKQIFPQRAFPYIELAELALGTKDWAEAARKWDEVRRKYPERKEGYYRGYLPYLHMQKKSVAEKILQNAARKWPENAEHWLHVIKLAEATKNLVDVVQCCEQVPQELLDNNPSLALKIFRKKQSTLRRLGAMEQTQDLRENPKFRRREQRLTELFDQTYPEFAARKLFDWSRLYPCFSNFSVMLDDFQSEFINSTNGVRTTTDTPKSYKYTLYFFGDSRVLGVGAPDHDTAASRLQRLINTRGLPIRVVNRGVSSLYREDIFLMLQDSDVQAGDFVVVDNTKPTVSQSRIPAHTYIESMYTYCRERQARFLLCQLPYSYAILNKSPDERNLSATNSNYETILHRRHRHALFSELTARGIPSLDLQPFFDRPHGMGELFFDNQHFVLEGNQKAAELIFDYFVLPAFQGDKTRPNLVLSALPHAHVLKSYMNNRDLKSWLGNVPAPPLPSKTGRSEPLS